MADYFLPVFETNVYVYKNYYVIYYNIIKMCQGFLIQNCQLTKKRKRKIFSSYLISYFRRPIVA